MSAAPFKICGNCGARWATLDDFLDDPQTFLTGYQVHYSDLKGGLFYFVHRSNRCGTTLAVPVADFTSLSPRPILTARANPAEGCSDLCARGDTATPCPEECECIWVREIMDIIHLRKKGLGNKKD